MRQKIGVDGISIPGTPLKLPGFNAENDMSAKEVKLIQDWNEKSVKYFNRSMNKYVKGQKGSVRADMGRIENKAGSVFEKARGEGRSTQQASSERARWLKRRREDYTRAWSRELGAKAREVVADIEHARRKVRGRAVGKYKKAKTITTRVRSGEKVQKRLREQRPVAYRFLKKDERDKRK